MDFHEVVDDDDKHWLWHEESGLGVKRKENHDGEIELIFTNADSIEDLKDKPYVIRNEFNQKHTDVIIELAKQAPNLPIDELEPNDVFINGKIERLIKDFRKLADRFGYKDADRIADTVEEYFEHNDELLEEEDPY
jgi:hypothetical protein